jgi:hypothetical protein
VKLHERALSKTPAGVRCVPNRRRASDRPETNPVGWYAPVPRPTFGADLSELLRAGCPGVAAAVAGDVAVCGCPSSGTLITARCRFARRVWSWGLLFPCWFWKSNRLKRSPIAGWLPGAYGPGELVVGFGRLSRLRADSGESRQLRSMNFRIDAWSVRCGSHSPAWRMGRSRSTACVARRGRTRSSGCSPSRSIRRHRRR